MQKYHHQRGQSVVDVALFVIVALIGIAALLFLWPMYSRYQRLADETNLVQVNDIAIKQTQQLVEVEKQKAQIRIQESIGIAKANSIINQTLTPQYLQHEAIQAQEKAAENSAHTETIYVPSGAQGIPLVNPVGVSHIRADLQ